MATTTAFPQKTFTPGVYASASVHIPATISELTIQCDVSGLTDPLTKISFLIEVSSDNGKTWDELLGGGTQGESPMTHTPMIIDKTFTDPSFLASKGSLLRGKLTVTGGDALIGPGTIALV